MATKQIKLSNAQLQLLRFLKAQKEAAHMYPESYTDGLTPGTYGCHSATASALVRLLLVEVGQKQPFGKLISINTAGLQQLETSHLKKVANV